MGEEKNMRKNIKWLVVSETIGHTKQTENRDEISMSQKEYELIRKVETLKEQIHRRKKNIWKKA